MRKIKSLVLIALTSFAIAACSSGNKEVEQASVDELYAKGAAALQEGSYSDSIRYLKAATERFPGSTYQEQAMLDLIYDFHLKALHTPNKILLILIQPCRSKT